MTCRRRAAVVAAAVLLVILVTPRPATAHAVLLRTEPVAQSTVPTPPSEIRLQFSEAIEVLFGAIRVYDVDGRRLPTGAVRRSKASDAVAVAVEGLGRGTHTVTFRAVSGDGHPVRGGFVFYVGAPSAVSAALIEGDDDGGRAVDVAYGAARFAWFAALLLLIGATVLRRFVWTPALRATGLDDGDAGRAFRDRYRSLLPRVWLLLAAATAVQVVAHSADIAGLSLADALDPTLVREALRTGAGRALTATAGLTALALLPVLGLASRRRLLRVPVRTWLAAGALVSVALAVASSLRGHSRTDPQPLLSAASLTVHLLAAAVWVGGLGALVLLAVPAARRLDQSERRVLLRAVVPRFSRLAIGATAAIVATGVVNSIESFEGVGDLWRVGYGRLVAAKIVLLVVALALGARHLLVLPRRLEGQAADRAVAGFRRTSAIEALLLTVVVALAAVLVGSVPGRALAQVGRGIVSLERRADDHLVQLVLDPSRPGANELHATFTDRSGIAAGDVVKGFVTVRGGSGPERSVVVRPISPGHFVGDVVLRPGRYEVTISGMAGSARPTAEFTFTLRSPG